MKKNNLITSLIATGLLTIVGGQAVLAQANENENIDALENTILNLEGQVPKYDLSGADTIVPCFPVDFTGYSGLGIAEIDLNKFVNEFKEKAQETNTIALSLRRDLSDLLEPSGSDVYKFEKASTEGDGLLYFSHDVKANNIATLAKFANEKNIPFENASEWAARYLKLNGADVDADDIIFSVQDNQYLDFFVDNADLMGTVSRVGNEQTVIGYGRDGKRFVSKGDTIGVMATVDSTGANADIVADSSEIINNHSSVHIYRGKLKVDGRSEYVTGSKHILVPKNGLVPVHPDDLMDNRTEELIELVATENLANDYECAALDLERLIDLMKGVRTDVSTSVSDNSLDFTETMYLNESIGFLNRTYDMVISNIEGALKDFSSQRIKDGYADLGEDVQEFWNEVQRRVGDGCPVEETEKKEERTIWSIESSVQKNFDGVDYGKFGLGIKSKKGTSLKFGATGHYNDFKSNTPETMTELPDGSFHFGQEWNQSTTTGIGGYIGLMQELVGNYLEVGVEYLFMPLNTESTRDKVEGRRNIPGNEAEVREETSYNNTNKVNMHLLGAGLTGSVPLFNNRMEVNLTPGVLYDVKQNKFSYGVRGGLSVNLNTRGGSK